MKYIEPYVIMDVFISGLAAVEVLKGGLVRFTHFVEQTDQNGDVIGVINSKIVMPMEAVVEAQNLLAMSPSGQRKHNEIARGH